MAITLIPTNKDNWVKIGDNIVSITFQNAGQYAMYVNYTDADVAPTDAVGFLYESREGELKKDLVDLTFIANAAYVWAKNVSSVGNAIVETP